VGRCESPCVLSLPSTQQEHLLRLAEAERWSVARLSEEVDQVLSQVPSRRGGRKRRGRLGRGLRILSRWANECDDGLLENIDWSRETAAEDRERATTILHRVRSMCSNLEAAILRASHSSAVDTEPTTDNTGTSVEWDDANERHPSGAFRCRPKILVLEDEDGLGRTLCRLGSPLADMVLAKTIREAETASESLSMPWRAALIDLLLPDGYGLEFLAWLRSRLPTVPVLVVTDHLDAQAVNTVFDLGFDFGVHFIVKPVVSGRILKFVEWALSPKPGLAAIDVDGAAMTLGRSA